MKNLLVCANSSKALRKINESAGENSSYVLEGVFAELDTLNRNKRIYPKDEYLKHLAYLRDDIKKGEPLLGELDHPEDRFEVKLKEASHKIVDLWYDADKNCVMGKIELLNTPNGKLAQSLVDQGIPLHISSRAAGTVGNDSKVSIQQIYTYDLVCKPGFAGAVLHRVNESVSAKYNADANRFLEESNRAESMNSAMQYGINESEMSIREVSYNAPLRKEAAELKENDNINEMKKPIKNIKENHSFIKDTVKTKVEKVFEEDDGEEKNDDSDSDSDNGNDEKKDDDIEILDVKAVTDEDEKDDDSDDVDIKDVKKDDEDDDSEDDSEDDSDEEEEKTDECAKGKNKNKKVDTLLDCNDPKKKQEKFEETFEDLVNTLKRKNEGKAKNESLLINKYPVFGMMNRKSINEVMRLDESQKSKVSAYLNDHNFCTPNLVNENWRNGVDYEPEKEVWLRYAPESYKRLFEKAPETIKESIRNTASYLLFENQYDVNNFWENTGLMRSEEKRIANEKFLNNMPRLNESQSANNDNNGLPYSKEFIQMVTEMACEYNS